MTRHGGPCPTCAGQGDIVFGAGPRGSIIDVPADGRADCWPCPTCGGRGSVARRG